MAELKYVYFDHHPAIHDGHEAWFIYDEEIGWKPAPIHEVIYNGYGLTREEFREILANTFTKVPALPKDAFRGNPSGVTARTRLGRGNATSGPRRSPARRGSAST